MTLPIQKTRSTYFLVFAAFFFLYLFLSRGTLSGGDDLIYLDIAQTFLVHGSFKESGITGEPHVSKYSLGQAIVDLPVALNFRNACLTRQSGDIPGHTRQIFIVAIWAAALTALQTLLFFRVCRIFSVRLPAAVAASASFGAGTMILVYSQKLQADVTLGLFLLAAFLAILEHRDGGRRRWLLLAGLSLGCAVVTKPYAVVLAALFSVYLLTVIRERVRAVPPRVATARSGPAGEGHCRLGGLAGAIIFVLPLAILCAIQLYYNHWRYDSVLEFGYDVGVDAHFGFSNPLFVGLFGFLLSPGKGIFWYNPILILSIAGIPAFFRADRRPAIFVALLVAVHTIFFSRWVMWHGDYAWGPRYMLTILPFLTLPCAFFFDRMFAGLGARRFCRYAVAIGTGLLLIGSVAIQIIGIIPDASDYITYVCRRTGIFPHPLFEKTVWPLRDDALMLHFVPDFSPIIGHVWMIKVIRRRNSDSLRHYLNNPPWRQLNEKWVPAEPVELPFKYNVWWLTARQSNHPHYLKIVSLATVLLALSLVCFLFLIQRSVRELRAADTH